MGSAESEEYDQVLDSVLVGPVPAGRHMFVFQVRKSELDVIPQSHKRGQEREEIFQYLPSVFFDGGGVLCFDRLLAFCVFPSTLTG